MKIWVDGQCFQSASRFRGIGRYATEFLVSLMQARPDDELHISLNANAMDAALTAHDKLSALLPEARFHMWHGVEDGGEGTLGLTDHIALSHAALLHHVACLAPDVAVSLSPFEGLSEPFSPYLPAAGTPFPTIGIFYDAIPKRLSSIYLNGHGISQAYDRRLSGHKHFDHLLSISEYSKSEAESLIPGVPATNMATGLNAGFKEALSKPAPCSVSTFIAPDKYSLLYVGGLDNRKNLPAAIKALGQLPKPQRSHVELILAGVKQTDELDMLALDWARSGLAPDGLKIFGFASDDELVGLYKSVDAVIQPSLLEGFGLTALEGISCGTPVLASNTGALPEVIRNENLLFDPADISSICGRILWAMTHPEDAKKAAEDALQQTEHYSWRAVAERASQVIDDLTTQSAAPAKRPIGDLRQEAAARLASISYDDSEKAAIMAASEPLPDQPGRFLIDITSTSRVDHSSGIQRVVRKISRQFATRDDSGPHPRPSFIATDRDRGFFRADIEAPASEWDSQRNHKIKFTSNDTILMLDSSWEFYAEHEAALQTARIEGATIYAVLYDLVPAMTPAFCDPGMPTIFVPWLKSCLTYSDGIVCISKAVANELLQLLEAIDFPRKVKVGYWHLGADFSDTTEQKTAIKRQPNNFLCVGTIEPRKGHELVLDAFETLWADRLDVELDLVGRPGWGTDAFVQRLLTHPEMGRRLRWHADADDAALSSQYAKAACLIAASYGEGFGLPLIEAADRGVPVIASDLPVFKEVAEGVPNTVFFETGNASALAETIRAFKPSTAKASKTKQTHALDWAGSAAQLSAVIHDGNWYRTYEPSEGARSSSRAYYDQMVMTRPLSIPERACSIQQIGAPALSKRTGELHVRLKVTNESDVTWSSRGQKKDKYALVIAGMLLDTAGEFMSDTAIRAKIPLIVPPGGSVIQTLSVPFAEIENGAQSVLVDVLQENVGVSGRPLEVSLIDWVDHARLSDSDHFNVTPD